MKLLKDDVANSFATGFDAALEQVVVIHKTIDLSIIEPCKFVVDRKLTENAWYVCFVLSFIWVVKLFWKTSYSICMSV